MGLDLGYRNTLLAETPVSVPASAFPTVDMLNAAVSMFPTDPLGWRNSERGRSWSDRDGAWLRREGGWPSLIVGPGVVQYKVTDTNRAEVDDEARTALGIRDGVFGAGAESVQTSSRGRVTGWSPKSRNGLRRKVGSLDLAEFVGSGRMAMVTLTLPGPWELVTPTAAEASALWRRFERRWFRKWGKLRCIWKREFQRRGAPHWHLWVAMPTEDLDGFREWLSMTWADCMRVGDVPLYQALPGDFLLSVAAGTGLDFAAADRATDPVRLVNYFLKESVNGESKAYQNRPPALWAGSSAGRFWGVLGIRDAAIEVCLDPRHSRELWRAMRRWRNSRGIVVARSVDRVDTATGEIRRRRVKRRVRVRSAAGFVMVPDGASYAADLGRYVTALGSPAPALTARQLRLHYLLARAEYLRRT